MNGYNLLCEQLRALASGETSWLALYANAAALLFEALDEINWAGFYFLESVTSGKEAREKEDLVLGPFQGKVACMHIGYGLGVCGTALARDEAQLVADVHAFPGHIACDAASRSEIVLPIHGGNKVIGVLDIDAPVEGRFTEEDLAGLRAFVRILEETGFFA